MKIALDSSVRSFDRDGMLHVEKSHITKATINPYYGREIPRYRELGLDANTIYRLLRPEDELIKAASSFAGKPILSKHIPINSVDLPQELIIGSIGSKVEFNAPYLDADLSFWQNDAIVAIDSGKIRELSCAYYYDAVMTPGEGYDGVMTNINANHLALVEVGRAGSDVMVADEKPLLMRKEAMKMSKLGKALVAALGLLSPKIAVDSALSELVGNANGKTLKKEEVSKSLLAMDADIDKKLLSEILDSVVALDEEVEVEIKKEDEDEEEEDEEEEKMSKKEVEAAMDSLKKSLMDAEEARRIVRPVVGDIVVAMDSASSVYKYALNHMKVDFDGIDDQKALKALFKVASSHKPAEIKTSSIAQDASSVGDLVKEFPNALRFK